MKEAMFPSLREESSRIACLVVEAMASHRPSAAGTLLVWQPSLSLIP